jgi:hypothetical protein
MPRNVTISDNVSLVPLNPMGAVELGLWPCEYCNAGWGIVSSTKSDSCHRTCQYLKDAIEKKSEEFLKNMGLKKGETLKIVKMRGKHGRHI